MADRANVPNLKGISQVVHMLRNRSRQGGVRIWTRLTGCFVVIVLAMMVADVVAIWQFSLTTAAARRLNQADQTSLAVVRLHVDVDTFGNRLAALTRTHDVRQFQTEAASLRQKFLEDVAHSQELLESSPAGSQDPGIPGALETLRTALPSQIETTVQLASVGDWAAISLRMTHQTQALIDLSSLLVEKVDRQVSQQRASAAENAQHARRRVLLIFPITSLLALIIAVVLGWRVTQTITGPLSALDAGAQALARGDFEHRVAIDGEDELAHLGQVFNDAARRLAVLYETVRQNEEREFNARIEGQVHERMRVARELHDTLLQSFQGLLPMFQAARNLLPGKVDRAAEVLDKGLARAANAIAEGRDAIQNLRANPSMDVDLDALLAAAGQELSRGPLLGDAPEFRVVVEGTRRPLAPLLNGDVYQIGRELLRNAFQHANARRIEVEIRYSDDVLQLRVRDDGKGIDPTVLNEAGRRGHWGLTGMRERAKNTGGQFTIRSKSGAGTEAELTIPARAAYAHRLSHRAS